MKLFPKTIFSVNQVILSFTYSVLPYSRTYNLKKFTYILLSGKRTRSIFQFDLGTNFLLQETEFQLKVKYSGGPGFKSDYCRLCSAVLDIEILSAVVLTGWEVQPGET